ncbi:MAG: short-chain fatty acyl-CoA regulator family protein, partial [Pseudomonadota bacterium]
NCWCGCPGLRRGAVGAGRRQRQAAVDELAEVFADPLFQNAGVGREDLHELATGNPVLADAVAALYRAYRDLGDAAEAAQGAYAIDGVVTSALDRDGQPPVEEVRDFIQSKGNYFAELDGAAERLHSELDLGDGDLYAALSGRLEDLHGLRVQVMPVDVMASTLRRFDRHGRRILLSEVLDQPARNFQLAFQLGLFEQDAAIDAAVAASQLSRAEARRLGRITLANYFAAALLMPYARFHTAAEELAYDIEMLSRRFGASFEQVCHRLTTMQRPDAQGVPFFLIRVDVAGNISKRFSGGVFPFSKSGGACPRWNVHDVFRVPGRIQTQIIQLPDNSTYFSIARTVRRPGGAYGEPDQELAVGLGCDIRHADRFIYASGVDLADPGAVVHIGINCRLCERPDCAQRAHPPLHRKLVLDETRRTATPFSFAFD